jgi:sulfotransferase family protein
MNKLFSGLGKKTQTKKPVIVVSGLPRSGTSMMMKILSEGGLPIVTDELRSADEDNPNGYFELETVKQMSTGNVAWLSDAGGKVVKVISALLEFLPADHTYKIIFMEREIKEILASQQKMLARRNKTSQVSDAEMEQQFRKHLSIIKPWLIRQPNMEVLYVSYNGLISEPDPLCRRVVKFVGLDLDLSKMLAVPSRELYRNRAPGS